MIESRAEGSFYDSLVWSIAACLIVTGITLAILMISAVLGPFRFVDPLSAGGAAPFGLWLRGGVGDVASPESMKRLVAWRSVAPIDVAFRESRTLDSLMDEGVGVLAIPDARSLSREEAVQLRRFLIDGGGVVLTGSIGVVDDAGQWRGYDLMQTLLEVESVVPLPTEVAASVVAARRGPLAIGLTPEEVIPLIAEPGVPAIANPQSELQWRSTAEDDDEGTTPLRDASKRLELGRGRLVWLATGPEGAVQRGAEPWRGMVRMMRSAVAWAGRRSQIEVLRWPEGAPFSVVLKTLSSTDGEQEALESATRLTERIERAEMSGGHSVAAVASSRDAITLQRKLADRGAWLPRPGQLLEWQRSQSQVSASTERVGSERLLVAVSNRGSEAARGVALRVHLGRRAASVELRPTTVGQAIPKVRFQSGRSYVDLPLAELARRSNQAFTLDFVELPPNENAQHERNSTLQISARTPISVR